MSNTNRQCQYCGGYELDNGVDDVCLCLEEDREICRECDGNGYTNPPSWTVKCKRCEGKGVV